MLFTTPSQHGPPRARYCTCIPRVCFAWLLATLALIGSRNQPPPLQGAAVDYDGNGVMVKLHHLVVIWRWVRWRHANHDSGHPESRGKVLQSLHIRRVLLPYRTHGDLHLRPHTHPFLGGTRHGASQIAEHARNKQHAHTRTTPTSLPHCSEHGAPTPSCRTSRQTSRHAPHAQRTRQADSSFHS